MIYALAVALIVLAGWSITGIIGGTRNVIERVGLSILLGMGLLTGLMFLLGFAGFPIAPIVYLPALALFAVDGLRRMIMRGRRATDRDVRPGATAPSLLDLLRPRQPVIAVPVLVLLAFLMAVMIARATYLPNHLYDSLTAFDLLGKIIAIEERFRVSLFDYTQIARGGSYPPFPALTFAWGYGCGLSDATCAMVLPLVAFAAWLFGFARRFVGAMSAWTFVLLTYASPDFYSWIHLPVANFAVTIFAAPALLYLFAGIRERSIREVMLATVAAVFLVWSRAEGAAFVAGGTLTLLIFGRRAGLGLRWFPYALFPAVVFVLWQVYATSNLGGVGSARFTDHLFWDGDRLAYLLREGGYLLFYPRGMGFSVWLLAGAIVAHTVTRRSGAGPVALASIGSLVLYLAVFYQIDPVKQDPLPALLGSSFRRGITAYVAPFWFVVLLSPLGVWGRRVLGRMFMWGGDGRAARPAERA